MEKFCLQHVLHEIVADPHLITYTFKSQKKYPEHVLADYFAVKTTRKVVKDLLDTRLKEFQVPNKEVYDGDKLKKELEHSIESNIVQWINDFDKYVSTRNT